MKLEERLQQLDEEIEAVGQNLRDANAELEAMDKTVCKVIKTEDANGREKTIVQNQYLEMAKVVDSLTRNYNDLVRTRCEIVKTMDEAKKSREKKLTDILDVTKLITCAATITATLVQSFAIYKWQRDGYLIGRDVSRMQMPRP